MLVEGTIVCKVNGSYPNNVQIVRKASAEMKFGLGNKFDLCFYGQVNSVRLLNRM